MDINQLEVLVAVAREKSFSRAAEALGRTQPAISQSIRRLEEEIGEPLFDRSSKDGTLTLAGETLLEHARQMLNLRRSAEAALREIRGLKRGRVTISANEHTVLYLLPVIEQFYHRHPSIKVEVQRGVASRIPKEVLAREVELGVISFSPSDASLKAIPVMNDRLTLIVSPRHALAGRDEVTIRDLANERFIAHNAVSPYRDLVISAFEKQNATLNIAVELPSLEAIKKLVARGIGIALVPRLSAAEEIASGQLSGVKVRELKLERKLNIVYRKNSTLSHAARAFLDVAVEMGR
ncbi:MAG: LysR family transcriptional regulator [Pyrinomonadaceae bacterium]